jgi:hypothetical protein
VSLHDNDVLPADGERGAILDNKVSDVKLAARNHMFTSIYL